MYFGDGQVGNMPENSHVNGATSGHRCEPLSEDVVKMRKPQQHHPAGPEERRRQPAGKQGGGQGLPARDAIVPAPAAAAADPVHVEDPQHGAGRRQGAGAEPAQAAQP